MNLSGSIKGRKYLYRQINYSLLKEYSAPLSENERQEHVSPVYLSNALS
jgi:hypothetical protein